MHVRASTHCFVRSRSPRRVIEGAFRNDRKAIWSMLKVRL